MEQQAPSGFLNNQASSVVQSKQLNSLGLIQPIRYILQCSSYNHRSMTSPSIMSTSPNKQGLHNFAQVTYPVLQTIVVAPERKPTEAPRSPNRPKSNSFSGHPTKKQQAKQEFIPKK